MGQGDVNINLPDGESFAPDPARVDAFEAMLGEETFHLGVPADDRRAWAPLREDEIGRRLLTLAREAADADPLPLVTDEIYLSCLADGSPAAMNAVAPGHRTRMALLPVAECLEPDGAFLPRIEADIEHTLALGSWTHPNNDEDRRTFDGDTTFNDLSSTHTAANLVTADYLLGDRLRPDLREGIRREVRRRVLTPFRERIESGQDVYWWVTVTHNWNSVCLMGTVACALHLEQDRRDRAWYLAVAELLIEHSEKGFTETGFYTEGVGYWAYGFGCYVTLAEMIRAATGGAVDWLTNPHVERVSHFGRRMQIQSGCYPTFADCRRDVDLPAWLLHWMNNRRDPARTARSTSTRVDPLSGNPFRSSLTTQLVLFGHEDVRAVYALEADSAPLREWWEDMQFLICRPRADARVRLASTFKGGDNSVNHNHNDLGTFTVLVGEHELLTDPGAEVYTKRTFSARRYEGQLLNSFGHPVPVVDGHLQPPDVGEYTVGVGGDVFTRVLSTSFNDGQDTVVLDLTRAYRAPALERLVRTFTHHRAGNGAVHVVDEATFSTPATFETALITYADWSTDGDALVVSAGDAALRIVVRSESTDLVFEHCVIQESSTPTRLSWRLAEPVRAAKVHIDINPLT